MSADIRKIVLQYIKSSRGYVRLLLLIGLLWIAVLLLSLPKLKTSKCDSAYPDVCIPPPPPDLNCKDINHQNFRVIKHPDPHGFDHDKDGIGCEKPSPKN